jgi:cobalamin-dependent methionine synthase I
MALSQDEQRVLAEIERRLAAEDPRLASSLATFRRPTPAAILRSPRARVIGSVFTVLLVAMVSLMVYAMIPFRDHNLRAPAMPSAASLNKATIAATGTADQLRTTQQVPSASEGLPVNNTTVSVPNSATPSSRATTKAHTTASSHATGSSTSAVGGP